MDVPRANLPGLDDEAFGLFFTSNAQRLASPFRVMRRFVCAGIGLGVSAAALTGCVGGTLTGLRELDGIEIEGNELLSDEEVKAGLAMEPSSWIPLLGQKRYFNADVLREDLRRVPRIYEAHGVYGTEVVSHRVDDLGDDEASVSVTVREGVPIRVAEVEVSGLPADLLGDRPPSLSMEGERFSEPRFELAKGELFSWLRDEGHYWAKVEGEVVVDLGTREARVRYVVTPGRRYVVGPVEFKGKGRTHPLQLHEHVAIQEGTTLRNRDVTQSRDRLSSLGVFHGVSVVLPDAPPEGTMAPVAIRVSEGDERNISAGAGLGVSTGRNEIRGRLNFTHNNLWGGLRRFDFELRPAYVYVPSFTEPDKKGAAGSAEVRLYQPEFLLEAGARKLGGTLSLKGARDIQETYVSDSAAFRTCLVWPAYSRSWMEGGYNFEIFNLGSLPPSVAQCPDFCTISFLDQSFILDRRDGISLPRSGWWLSLGLSEAGLGGDFRYVRATPEARGYVPLLANLTAASRAQAGSFFRAPGNDTPIPKRYYLGGANSHRGFGNRRLAPSVPRRSAKGRVPIGGESMLLFNQELRWEAVDKLFVIGFFDTGAVNVEQRRVPAETLNHAVGLGLQYDTGVIPVRIDVGYRTNRRPEYAHEGAFAFHFNLGEAF
jgi:outer membrane protein assembly factor BamA